MKTAGAANTNNSTAEQIVRLTHEENRHWFVMASVTILSTAALTIAIAPGLSERIAPFWPWADTPIVLLSGLSVSTFLLVGYLTLQQRRVRRIRGQVNAMIEESAQRARQNSARLHALLNVSRMMGTSTSVDSVFSHITKTCLDVFDCQTSSLMTMNPDTGRLETQSVASLVKDKEDTIRKATPKIGEGIAGWVAEQRKPLLLARGDLSSDAELKLRDQAISAAMVVPIVVRDELVGVLNISSRSQAVSYDDEDLRALQVFAENAGTCIRHTEHVEWMRQSIQQLQEKAGPRKNKHSAPHV